MTVPASAGPVLLGPAAASSCPVKTEYRFDPRRVLPEEPTGSVDTAGELRRETARRFAAVTVERVIEAGRGHVVDLRLLADEGPAVRSAATLRALRSGAAVVAGGLLPVDLDGHRAGSPDLLVRGADRADGSPAYHPVSVRWHKIVEPARRPRGEEPPAAVLLSTLAEPHPDAGLEVEGHALRLRFREGDFSVLAHFHRMLQAAGFGADRALGAVIGTDELPGGPHLCWLDLDVAALRTFSRREPEGWRLRSVTDRYDHAHAHRVLIAEAARSGDVASGVQPVVTDECSRCAWAETCRARLDPDDVSARIDKGALDRREVENLRRLGLGTVHALATADLEPVLAGYLREVSHRGGAEARLRTAVRRSVMLVDGRRFARETTGPVEVATADVEVDFDLESSTDGHLYLWGFWVERPAVPGSGHYVEFSRFRDLDADGEVALAVEALGWLRGLVGRGESVAVFHYSAYEVTQLQTLAARSGHPDLVWAAAYAAEQFVDLLEVVKQHFFGVSGLGLKLVAAHAGFAWRDEDPGGLNSQLWFAEAVHGSDAEVRAAATRRVLEYNEDDVLATGRLRAWLREQ